LGPEFRDLEPCFRFALALKRHTGPLFQIKQHSGHVVVAKRVRILVLRSRILFPSWIGPTQRVRCHGVLSSNRPVPTVLRYSLLGKQPSEVGQKSCSESSGRASACWRGWRCVLRRSWCCGSSGIEIEAGRRQSSTPPPGPLRPRPWVLGYAGHGADDRRAAKVNRVLRKVSPLFDVKGGF